MIDDAIREVVDLLNALPGVETFSSCGGHKEIGSISQRREGHFFVAFQVTQNQDGWESLARIAYLITCLPGLKLLAWYNGFLEPFLPAALSFQLEGNPHCDRRILADELIAIGQGTRQHELRRSHT